MQSGTRPTAAVYSDAVTRVYHGAGNVIETHEHEGDFREAEFKGRAIAARSQRSMQAVEHSFRDTPVHTRSECPEPLLV
jgi:hypothetical protein